MAEAAAAHGTILVLNAGSSSLKYAVFRGLSAVTRGQVEGIGTRPAPECRDHARALVAILASLSAQGLDAGRLAGAGHRIVHGGAHFIAPTRIDAASLGALDALRALAPAHNGFGLDAIRSLMAAAPGLPQVACFDTAFHAGQPDVAARLPLPQEFHDAGYRRYGFHGLSYEHVAAELPRLSGRPLPARLLAFHLGNGSSACAILEGRSVATTMGYSTLDGLVMGTRSGSMDPGVLIALMRDRGMGADELEALLYRRSGLLGLSGASSDMRALLASDAPGCARAVEHYSHSAARHGATLAVDMGGLDAIAFTGGIGANAAAVRSRIVAKLAWLGASLDEGRNAGNAGCVSAAASRIAVWVIPADEELVIARHAAAAILTPA